MERQSNDQTIPQLNVIAKKRKKRRCAGTRAGHGGSTKKGNTSRAVLQHEHTASASFNPTLSLLIMKLSAAAFSLFLFVGSTSAQYFSVGWSPGQKVSSQNPPAKSSVPPQESSTSQTAAASEKAPSTSTPNSFIEKLLTSGPAAALLSSFGLNVSAAINEKLWDERIQLITDENYQDVIVNETLTSKEEKERTWVIIMYVLPSSSRRYRMSNSWLLVQDRLLDKTSSRNLPITSLILLMIKH